MKNQIYTIVYANGFTGMQEIAGYRNTVRGAQFLAKSFLKDVRLCKGVKIYKGQPGGEVIFKTGDIL